MRVTAIIVTYNGRNYIKTCIDSLYESSVDSIIIVDNLSTDDTLDIIKNNFPAITLIALHENVGFGRANNIGIIRGLEEGTDYFLLINQDAYIESDGVNKLVDIFEKNKQYGIVAPIQLNGAGDDIDVKFYNYLFYQNKEIGYRLYKQEREGVYPVSFVNAAAWLMSRECIETVGGFDPIFFHTGEDDDYTNRVKYWNYKIGIAPSVSVRHDRPQLEWISIPATIPREVTLNIVELKNIEHSISRNVKVFLKKELLYLIFSLLLLNFKKFRMDFTAIYRALKLMPVIKRSRKISYQKFAFLQ